jgi:hypothetical protein
VASGRDEVVANHGRAYRAVDLSGEVDVDGHKVIIPCPDAGGPVGVRLARCLLQALDSVDVVLAFLLTQGGPSDR